MLDKIYRQTELLHTSQDKLTREQFQNFQMKKWEQKKLTAKVIFQLLALMIKSRQGIALNEISEYSKFDRQCYIKLRKFSVAVNHLGTFQKKRAMFAWYNNACKPMHLKHLNLEITGKVSWIHLKRRVFYAWRNSFDHQVQNNDCQTTSIKIIKQKIQENYNQELKRAFAIWKGVL